MSIPKTLRLDSAPQDDPTIQMGLPLSVWRHLLFSIDGIVNSGSECIDDYRVAAILARGLDRRGYTWAGPLHYVDPTYLNAIRALVKEQEADD